MKHNITYVLIIALIVLINCSNVSPDAIEMKVDFTWDGLVPCALGGNPEIRISGIPEGTKTFVVSLYDHGMSHGKQTLGNDGSGIIRKGALDEIEGPCPFADSGRYKFKVEAVNANKKIIGIGSLERNYPEVE